MPDNLDDIDLSNTEASESFLDIISNSSEDHAAEIQNIVNTLHTDVDAGEFNIDLDELLSGTESAEFYNSDSIADPSTVAEIDSITARVLGTTHLTPYQSEASPTQDMKLLAVPTGLSNSSSAPATPTGINSSITENKTSHQPEKIIQNQQPTLQKASSAPPQPVGSSDLVSPTTSSNLNHRSLSAKPTEDRPANLKQFAISRPDLNVQKTSLSTMNTAESFRGVSSTPISASSSGTRPSAPASISITRPNLTKPLVRLPITPSVGNSPSLQSAPIRPGATAGASSGAQASGHTLLDTILSQLPPEKQDILNELFRQLQQHHISSDIFLSQARRLLGTQHSKLLSDIPRRPPRHSTNNQAAQQAPRPPRATPLSNRTHPALPAYNAFMKRRQAEQQMASPIMTAAKKLKTDGSSSIPGSPLRPSISPSSPSIPSVQPPSPMVSTPNIASPRVATPTIGRPPSNIQSKTQTGNSSGQDDKVDFDALTDVMGYVGVDLKEESDNILRESETLSKHNGLGVVEADQSKTQDFMSLSVLKKIVGKIAEPHRLSGIDPDFMVYLALAAQERLKSLVEQMIVASKHRVVSHHIPPPPLDANHHPMYKIVVNQDVKKQLLALERVEREGERHRKRMISDREKRLAQENTESEDKEDGKEGENKKSKKVRRKEGSGPGVTARNMSEDIRKKITNQTALLSAGGVRKSWMLMGAGGDGGSSAAASSKTATSSPAQSPRPQSPTIKTKPTPTVTPEVLTPTTPQATVQKSHPSNTSNYTPSPLANRGRGRPSKSHLRNALKGGLAPQRSQSAPGFVLPPSTVNRPSSVGPPNASAVRKVTVRDALFCLERDTAAPVGYGNGERVLLKVYTKWQK
ncbi:hypothetical protein K7432_006721 [Basidiobolus ranarum]|uniref:Transcription initiation factor TFIID subunit 4 n=1 Tax=Basidiobolus ranarum TaxID=34480 RepID=A0ABR2WUF3_9FUNG